MFDLVQICNIFWLIGFCKTFILKKTHIFTPMPVHVNNEKFQLCNLIRHIGVVICFFRQKNSAFYWHLIDSASIINATLLQEDKPAHYAADHREPRKTYCVGISCTCEPRFVRALLRVSAQYSRRSLWFFEVRWWGIRRYSAKNV